MDGVAQALHGQGIFRAHVDIAAVGADGVAAQHHAFDEAVRVAFQDGAIHEGAGVAFVGVANHVLLFAGGLHARLPFDARGEARAAAPAKAAALDFLHHVRRAARQRLGDGGVSVAGDVGLQGGVFHLAAVAQRNAHLLAEKADVLEVRKAALLLVVIEGVLLHDFALQQVAAGDHRGAFGVEVGVQHAFGLHHHHRPHRANANAARDHNPDALPKAQLFHGRFQRILDLLAMAADATRAAANHHLPLKGGLLLFVGGFDVAQHAGG